MDDQRVKIGTSIVHGDVFAIYGSGVIKRKLPKK